MVTGLRMPVKVICSVILLTVVGEAIRESCVFVLVVGIDLTVTVIFVLLLVA
jgi:hypothetical protein